MSANHAGDSGDDPGGEVPIEDAAAFEVARQVLAELVGYASHQVDAAESADEAKQWRERRDGWAKRQRELRVSDTLAVRCVLDEDAPFLRSLPAG